MKRFINVTAYFLIGLILSSADGCHDEQAKNGVIAHRGYWRADGATENSIAALSSARKAGVYGSEFDVWITADGVTVVYHDANVNGVNIEKANYAEIKDVKLANGESLPTLDAYLKAGASGKSTRLILEIKPHSEAERENAVVQEVVRQVALHKLVKQTEYISFSKNVCSELHRLAPKAKVAYLKGDLTPAEIRDLGWTGIDYNLSVFRRQPEWIAEARALGISTNVWTVNREEDMLWCLAQNIDFITTDEPVKLLEIIASGKSTQMNNPSK